MANEGFPEGFDFVRDLIFEDDNQADNDQPENNENDDQQVSYLSLTATQRIKFLNSHIAKSNILRFQTCKNALRWSNSIKRMQNRNYKIISHIWTRDYFGSHNVRLSSLRNVTVKPIMDQSVGVIQCESVIELCQIFPSHRC